MKTINKTQQYLGILIIFCMTLQLIRVHITQSIFFSFLLWNLLLAILPYGISLLIEKRKKHNKAMYVLLAVWLLFLPNSPYLITDFIHLQNPSASMIWFDILLVFSYAVTGLVLTLLSTQKIYNTLQVYYKTETLNNIMNVIFVLCGYGVYLGRFLRFNSWDVITKPGTIFKETLFSFTDEKAWGITLAIGLLIKLLFEISKNVQLTTKNA